MIDKREEINAKKRMGWVKIAFVYSFVYLLMEKNYTDAIALVIQKGGDTDTNAAIVGGMIGAAEGFNKIPEHIRDTMLKCDPEKGEVVRPAFLCPLKCLLLKRIKKLFDSRPTEIAKFS